jgi:hypothetical protein
LKANVVLHQHISDALQTLHQVVSYMSQIVHGVALQSTETNLRLSNNFLISNDKMAKKYLIIYAQGHGEDKELATDFFPVLHQAHVRITDANLLCLGAV